MSNTKTLKDHYKYCMYTKEWSSFVDKKETLRFSALVAKLKGSSKWTAVTDIPHSFMIQMNKYLDIDCPRCRVTVGFDSPDINPYSFKKCLRYCAAFTEAQNVRNRFNSLHHAVFRVNDSVKYDPTGSGPLCSNYEKNKLCFSCLETQGSIDLHMVLRYPFQVVPILARVFLDITG